MLLGGPEIIIGKIEQVQGEEYSIQGDHGQSVKLRLTKDTNMVCAGGEVPRCPPASRIERRARNLQFPPATEGQMQSHDASKETQPADAGVGTIPTSNKLSIKCPRRRRIHHS